MKKNTLLKSTWMLIFAFVICFGTQAQVYSGNLSLNTQYQVNTFIYTEVTHTLSIHGADITDLSPLLSLTTVGGNLYITNNAALTSLAGFENLTSIGRDLTINDNDVLTSLEGLENLTSLGGGVTISDNDALISLTELENLTSLVWGLTISDNAALTSLAGLENLTSMGWDLTINDNDVLTSLAGLENLTSFGGGVTISDNDALISLAGLGNLTSVEGDYIRIVDNAALTSLTGLEKLTTVTGDLYINNNGALTSLTELENLTSLGGGVTISGNDALISLEGLENLTSVGGKVTISDNAALTGLAGLENLTSVGEKVTISYNAALASLEGLGNLTTLHNLTISNNAALTSLSGLENLTSVGEHLLIEENNVLTSLAGLGNLTTLHNLTISNNAALTSLSGLENLTSVGEHVLIEENNVLTSLAGLGNLTTLHNLTISNNAALTSLSGLENLTSVGEHLLIEENNVLTSLAGLGNLTSLHNLTISNNAALTSLSGLENLTSVGEHLLIEENNVLTSLAGLGNLTSLHNLTISNNAAQTSLAGLENLTSFGGGVTISDNDALISLAGLGNLTSVEGDYIRIVDNAALTSLTGLEKLTTVTGALYINNNDALTSLTELENLTSAHYLNISDNDVLSSFCALYGLINGGGIAGTYYVIGNAENPTQQQIIDEGPCTLNVSIPDANFEQALIDLGWDTDPIPDGHIAREDAEAITSLAVHSKEIEDLTGIEGFTNLTSLDCRFNELMTINLVQNTALITLMCAGNQLTELDISQNSELTYILCSNNQIAGLDVSQCTGLKNLFCSNNNLSELIVSANTELLRLDCGVNQLQAIDVTKNTALIEFKCHSNLITTLDLRLNIGITKLICENNPLTELDISNNTALQYLNCGKNQLSVLDVSGKTSLKELECYHNQLTELDLSQNIALTKLICHVNDLTHLDVRNGNNASITSFNAASNDLSCINVDNELAIYSSWNVDTEVIFSNDCNNNTQSGGVAVPLEDVTTGASLVEVTFENVTLSGSTSLETNTSGPVIPTGFSFGEPPIYYDVTTTAEYTGLIQIVIDYSGINYVNEENLRLLHYDSDHWVDVTTEIDLNNKMIYGEVLYLSPFVVVEDNDLPNIEIINVPLDPVALSNPVNITAAFTDNKVNSATIDWGGLGYEIEGDIIGNTVSWNYMYTEPGVYAVTIQWEDRGGTIVDYTYQFIVIYDPTGGFVTGGGWINSPLGAYLDDPLLEGKANFGFVSKYKKGTTIPTGNTEFQFKAGDLNFNSSLYDWLVIAGTKAMFKGEGTINGSGTYGFMISAIDGDLKDQGEDMFRIKIWDKMNGDAAVYDNQIGDTDDADQNTELGGGSIVIHKSSIKKGTSILKEITEVEGTEVKVYPNPFNNSIYIDLISEASNEIIIDMIDMNGRVIEYMYTGTIKENINHHFDLNTSPNLTPGFYMLRIRTDDGELLTRERIMKQ